MGGEKSSKGFNGLQQGYIMMYAISDGKKVEAYPNGRAKCQGCKEEVIAKCGAIVRWHWAHKHTCDCNYKPMTEWHYKWQEQFPEENREVYVNKEDGSFRIADIKLDSGLVIEFQHSSISLDTVKSRQEFHGDVIWIFDCTEKFDNMTFYSNDDGTYAMKWKWAWKTAMESDRVYLNVADNILFDTRKKKFIKVVDSKMCFATTEDLKKFDFLNIYKNTRLISSKYPSNRPSHRFAPSTLIPKEKEVKVENMYFDDSFNQMKDKGYEVLYKDNSDGGLVMRKDYGNGVHHNVVIERYI